MKSHIPTLKKILAKARTSPMLDMAIADTIRALEAKDLALACELTACKSHIIGSLEPKNKLYAFQEDHDFNVTLNKDKASVYTILDVIHHDIAWKLDVMPSGMVMGCSGPKGIVAVERPDTKLIHPVVKRIQLERNRGRREAAKRFTSTKRRS